MYGACCTWHVFVCRLDGGIQLSSLLADSTTCTQDTEQGIEHHEGDYRRGWQPATKISLHAGWTPLPRQVHPPT